MNQTPTTTLRRLALTGLVALEAFDEDSNPSLRSPEARHAIAEYDAAMGRIDDVMRLASLDSINASAGEYLHERDRLIERMTRQASTLGHYAEALDALPRLRTDRVIPYLHAAAHEVNERLDLVEAALDLTGEAYRERMATIAGTDAEGLEDAVTHILDSARRNRKQYSKVYKIPRAFRSLLRHDAALKVFQSIRPAFDRTEKKRAKTTFEDDAWDTYVPDGIKGKHVQRAYDQAMRMYMQSLQQGTLRGGVGASHNIGRISNTGFSRPKVVTLASKAKKLCKWAINLVLTKDSAAVQVRISLTDKGIAKVLQAWVKDAMETMQQTATDPTAQREYIVEQMDDTLDHNKQRFSRSWQKGEIHTQVTLAEDGEAMTLKLEALRTTEMELPSGDEARSKQLLTMHALNRSMIGNRTDAERKARQVASRIGGELVQVQEIRQRSNDLHTNGYRFFFSLPLQVRSNGVIRGIADLLWELGKGKSSADPDDVKQMAEFEEEFGVSRTRRQSSKIKNKQRQKKLAARITRILESGDFRLSRRERKELERLRYALTHKIVTSVNFLVLEVPAMLEEIEETKRRNARVGGQRVSHIIDPMKLRGRLSRMLPTPHRGVCLRRVAAQGFDKGVLPRKADLVDLLVAQAEQDRQQYGRNGDTFVLHFKNTAAVEDSRLADITGPDGTVMKVAGVGKKLRVEVTLTPEVRGLLAA